MYSCESATPPLGLTEASELVQTLCLSVMTSKGAGTAVLSSFTAQIGIQSEKKKLLEREIKIQVAG